MSSFVDFCGLGGVRTRWCSWVHIHICCEGCGVHKPIGSYWRWCTWYVPCIFVLNVQFSLSVQCNQQLQKHHLSLLHTYWHTNFKHMLKYIVLSIYQYFNNLLHTCVLYFSVVSPYTQHTTQLSTNNLINISYFNIDIKLLFKA
jgi:hypothetical protein